MPNIDKDNPHTPESTTHWACDDILQNDQEVYCCGCTQHECKKYITYNPLSHKESECRNDHPTL